MAPSSTSTATNGQHQGNSSIAINMGTNIPASARVLNLPELLEHILINLTPRQLFAVARVSRTFNETLKTSKLRKHLKLAHSLELSDAVPASTPPPVIGDTFPLGEFIYWQCGDVLRYSPFLDSSFPYCVERMRNLTDTLLAEFGPFNLLGASLAPEKNCVELQFHIWDIWYDFERSRNVGLFRKGAARPDGLQESKVLRFDDTPDASWTKMKILDIATRVVIISSIGSFYHDRDGSFSGYRKPPELSRELSPKDATVGSLFKVLQEAMSEYESIIEAYEKKMEE